MRGGGSIRLRFTVDGAAPGTRGETFSGIQFCLPGIIPRPLKNGFTAARKSFSLLVGWHIITIIMINYKMLNLISERRKTFDSPLMNHFSAVMQSSLKVNGRLVKPGKTGKDVF